jgi:Protein of unknown function (DUF664)
MRSGEPLRENGEMTWKAPEIDRNSAPYLGDERTVLDGWLDCHRDTLLLKCAGLGDEQLKTASVDPSNLTLLGLVRHMTENERWFGSMFTGEEAEELYATEDSPEGDLDVTKADGPANLEAFRAQVEQARAAAPRRALDDLVDIEGESVSVRGLYVHMIEEYARHNGHADLIRERIDGATGD